MGTMMTLSDFIRNLTHLIFVIIGLVTMWDYLRNRNETRLKIALLAGSIAWTVVMVRITPLFSDSATITRIATIILIAYPYLLLVVVDLFHAVPRWLLLGILAATMVTGILVLLTPQPMAPLLLLFLITYFVIAQIYSTFIFVRGAFTKRGVVRNRMQLAALGTGLLAASFVISGISSSFPDLSDNLTLLQQSMTALSGIAYYLGFAAPRSLRRMWQFAELYRFLSQARAMTHEERVAQAFDMLRQSATQVTHGQEALLLNFDPNQQQLQFPADAADLAPHAEHITTTSPALQSAVLQFTSSMATAKDELSASERQLLNKFGVDTIYYVPIRAIDGLQGVLAVFIRDYPLFPEDDLNLLQLFGEQYGLMMEYGYHILEKDRVIEEMVDFTAVQTLRHEQERQRYFGVSQNLLAVWDKQHQFILLNPAWQRTLGYEQHELMSMRVENLIYPPDREAMLLQLQKLENGEDISGYEARMLTKSGDLRWFSWWISTLPEAGSSYYAAAHNITSIKEAEAEMQTLNEALVEEQQRLQQVIRSVPGIVWESRGNPFDDSYEVYFVSDYIEQMLGYTAAESYEIPNFWVNILHSDDRNHAIQQVNNLMARGGQGSIEFRWITKDGREIWCLSRISVIVDDDGKPVARSGVTIDITPIKLAEAEMQALNEQVLRERERLQHVINNVPGIVWETYGSRQNANFRSEFISDYVEPMLGYSVSEVRNDENFWYDIIHPDDRENIVQRVREIARDGGQGTVEYRWITKSGVIIWCLSRLSVIYDEAGNPIGQSGVTIDITPMKEAEQARARLAAIVESSQDAIIGHTVDGIITSWNYGAEEMYGYKADDIIGQSIEKLWYHPPADKLQTLQTALLAGEYFERNDTRHVRKDGTIFAVAFTTSSVRDSAGQLMGASTIAHDITPQKQAEEELRNYAAKLVQSNKSLEEFAYIASHDLQEPLRKIQAFGDRLVTRYTTVLDETGQDYLRRMQDAAGRMRNLINDLLTFSRLTSHPKDFEKVDLNVVLKSVVSDLERRLQETHGKIIVGDLTSLDAASSQMYQLFQNLLSNSLKYCRDGVPPLIEVSGEHITFAPGIEPAYRITIKDNGIGFDNKYNEKIFDLFERLHTRTEYDGTGIGLAICRKIVEQHNGTISATGLLGEGATFTIVLPLKHKRLSTYV
jgi:PAS domain S-box-containing protein